MNNKKKFNLFNNKKDNQETTYFWNDDVDFDLEYDDEVDYNDEYDAEFFLDEDYYEGWD